MIWKRNHTNAIGKLQGKGALERVWSNMTNIFTILIASYGQLQKQETVQFDSYMTRHILFDGRS